MELFKYRGNFERDLNSLVANEIYAPTYDRLNDPFEGLLDEDLDKTTLNFFNSFGENNLQEAYDSVIETLKKVGVYSLSKDEKNEILWSLYANGHEGFVIGYDIDKFLKDFNFNKNVPLVHKIDVRYEETPSGIINLRNQTYRNFDIGNAIGIKSKSWKHEEECRLIFEQSGNNIYNFNSITRIIFGLRTKEENIDKMMKLLKGRNYKYQRIVKIENSYKLDIIDLKDRYPSDIKYKQNCANFDENLISEKRIGFLDKDLKEEINSIISEVRNLPNISEITLIEIMTDVKPEILNIFCKHNHKNLPMRFFQFKKIDKGFSQIN